MRNSSGDFAVLCPAALLLCLYQFTESGLKLLGLDLASLVTQGVGAGAQPNAYSGAPVRYGFITNETGEYGFTSILNAPSLTEIALPMGRPRRSQG